MDGFVGYLYFGSVIRVLPSSYWNFSADHCDWQSRFAIIPKSICSHKFFPPLLFRLYSLGLFLGGIYSVPPIRTKKNPILAGLTIATVRGFLLNFGIYYAVKDAVGAPFAWSPKVAFVARFMTAFASVIAITKDLPDIEGDKVCLFALLYCVVLRLSFLRRCLLVWRERSY